jgi:hypothetical protein
VTTCCDAGPETGADARICACERRIRKLEELMVKVNSDMRFLGTGLLTEFKIALRAHRQFRRVLLRSGPSRDLPP